jgi:hypothetical protein
LSNNNNDTHEGGGEVNLVPVMHPHQPKILLNKNGFQNKKTFKFVNQKQKKKPPVPTAVQLAQSRKSFNEIQVKPKTNTKNKFSSQRDSLNSTNNQAIQSI